MRSYLARRLGAAGLTLFVLSFLVFFLGSINGDSVEGLASAGLQPGEEPSPARIAEIRHELGLDRPIVVRYADWLGDALHGDFGTSLSNGRRVADAIRLALPSTVGLTAAAFLVVVGLAVPFGTIAALYHRRWPDSLLRVVALTSASVPGFFLAYVLVYVAAVRLHLLPVAGTQGIRSLVLPALTVGLGPAALVSRLLRSSLLEVFGEGYMVSGRAKGLATAPLVIRHALRNGALPVITVLGGVLARLLEGAVIAEIIFSRSGMGGLTYSAVSAGDYPLIEGTVLFAGVLVITANLLVDLSYSIVDARVRVGAGS